MNLSTASWGWPQWIILSLLFVRLLATAIQHGKPMLDRDGDTMRHNGFGGVCHFMLWTFLLTAGGFFA